MSFWLFVLFFVATLLLCLALLNIGKFEREKKGFDTSNKAGLAVTFAIVLGWILLQVAYPFFPSKEFALGLYPFLIAAVSLSVYSIRKGRINRFWIYLFVTLLSVAFLPENSFVFQGLLPLFYDRFLAALLWAIFIYIYTRIDKLSGLTIIQTSALCLGFSFFSIITMGKLYAVDFCFYPMLILASLIGFVNYKKYTPDALLGKTGSAPLGYLMGLFFALLAIKGYWIAFFIMPFYYYFEFIYSFIYQLFHRNTSQPVPFSFFISWVIRRNMNIKGLFSRLFLVMFLFACIGLLFNQNIRLMFVLVLFLCVSTLYKLLYWGQPKITWRSMFHDTKEAFGVIKSNVKDSYDTVSTYIKDKNRK